ncbi:MAG: hypothetical protein PVI66_02855 [Candidatus Aminicenantes bacterium]|jgi:hypothetical protein
MKIVNRILPFIKICLAGVLILCILAAPQIGLSQQEVRMHYQTDWRIAPSLKYDAICLINTLTGDPFYLKYYQREYEEFAQELADPVREALAHLKQVIKENHHLIVSAFLSLYFSASDEDTLDGLLAALENSEPMKKNLKETPYYSDEGWELFASVREKLKTVFVFLKDIEFESYWRKYVVPKAVERIKKIRKELPKYNVVAEVESHLGVDLPSHTITVYLLYFTKPHGLKVTGTRFLTHVDWPFATVLRNAVHEMMHPPFDLVNDRELRKTLASFKDDEFLMDRIRNHDPAYGYNTFEGFIEEDCVQALEQVINEKMGVAIDAHRRWKESDGGMHVFAVALYSMMKEEHFNEKGETFRDFLVRIIRSQKLAPGKIKSLYDRFYE